MTIPQWVKDALDAKLADGDVGSPDHLGIYNLFVRKGHTLWCGRIYASSFPAWYEAEDDPTKQSGTKTWQDCYIIFKV